MASADGDCEVWQGMCSHKGHPLATLTAYRAASHPLLGKVCGQLEVNQKLLVKQFQEIVLPQNVRDGLQKLSLKGSVSLGKSQLQLCTLVCQSTVKEAKIWARFTDFLIQQQSVAMARLQGSSVVFLVASSFLKSYSELPVDVSDTTMLCLFWWNCPVSLLYTGGPENSAPSQEAQKGSQASEELKQNIQQDPKRGPENSAPFQEAQKGSQASEELKQNIQQDPKSCLPTSGDSQLIKVKQEQMDDLKTPQSTSQDPDENVVQKSNTASSELVTVNNEQSSSGNCSSSVKFEDYACKISETRGNGKIGLASSGKLQLENHEKTMEVMKKIVPDSSREMELVKQKVTGKSDLCPVEKVQQKQQTEDREEKGKTKHNSSLEVACKKQKDILNSCYSVDLENSTVELPSSANSTGKGKVFHHKSFTSGMKPEGQRDKHCSSKDASKKKMNRIIDDSSNEEKENDKTPIRSPARNRLNKETPSQSKVLKKLSSSQDEISNKRKGETKLPDSNIKKTEVCRSKYKRLKRILDSSDDEEQQNEEIPISSPTKGKAVEDRHSRLKEVCHSQNEVKEKAKRVKRVLNTSTENEQPTTVVKRGYSSSRNKADKRERSVQKPSGRSSSHGDKGEGDRKRSAHPSSNADSNSSRKSKNTVVPSAKVVKDDVRKDMLLSQSSSGKSVQGDDVRRTKGPSIHIRAETRQREEKKSKTSSDKTTTDKPKKSDKVKNGINGPSAETDKVENIMKTTDCDKSTTHTSCKSVNEILFGKTDKAKNMRKVEENKKVSSGTAISSKDPNHAERSVKSHCKSSSSDKRKSENGKSSGEAKKREGTVKGHHRSSHISGKPSAHMSDKHKSGIISLGKTKTAEKTVNEENRSSAHTNDKNGMDVSTEKADNGERLVNRDCMEERRDKSSHASHKGKCTAKVKDERKSSGTSQKEKTIEVASGNASHVEKTVENKSGAVNKSEKDAVKHYSKSNRRTSNNMKSEASVSSGKTDKGEKAVKGKDSLKPSGCTNDKGRTVVPCEGEKVERSVIAKDNCKSTTQKKEKELSSKSDSVKSSSKCGKQQIESDKTVVPNTAKITSSGTVPHREKDVTGVVHSQKVLSGTEMSNTFDTDVSCTDSGNTTGISVKVVADKLKPADVDKGSSHTTKSSASKSKTVDNKRKFESRRSKVHRSRSHKSESESVTVRDSQPAGSRHDSNKEEMQRTRHNSCKVGLSKSATKPEDGVVAIKEKVLDQRNLIEALQTVRHNMSHSGNASLVQSTAMMDKVLEVMSRTSTRHLSSGASNSTEPSKSDHHGKALDMGKQKQSVTFKPCTVVSDGDDCSSRIKLKPTTEKLHSDESVTSRCEMVGQVKTKDQVPVGNVEVNMPSSGCVTPNGKVGPVDLGSLADDLPGSGMTHSPPDGRALPDDSPKQGRHKAESAMLEKEVKHLLASRQKWTPPARLFRPWEAAQMANSKQDLQLVPLPTKSHEAAQPAIDLPLVDEKNQKDNSTKRSSSCKDLNKQFGTDIPVDSFKVHGQPKGEPCLPMDKLLLNPSIVKELHSLTASNKSKSRNTSYEDGRKDQAAKCDPSSNLILENDCRKKHLVDMHNQVEKEKSGSTPSKFMITSSTIPKYGCAESESFTELKIKPEPSTNREAANLVEKESLSPSRLQTDTPSSHMLEFDVKTMTMRNKDSVKPVENKTFTPVFQTITPCSASKDLGQLSEITTDCSGKTKSLTNVESVKLVEKKSSAPVFATITPPTSSKSATQLDMKPKPLRNKDTVKEVEKKSFTPAFQTGIAENEDVTQCGVSSHLPLKSEILVEGESDMFEKSAASTSGLFSPQLPGWTMLGETSLSPTTCSSAEFVQIVLNKLHETEGSNSEAAKTAGVNQCHDSAIEELIAKGLDSDNEEFVDMHSLDQMIQHAEGPTLEKLEVFKIWVEHKRNKCEVRGSVAEKESSQAGVEKYESFSSGLASPGQNDSFAECDEAPLVNYTKILEVKDATETNLPPDSHQPERRRCSSISQSHDSMDSDYSLQNKGGKWSRKQVEEDLEMKERSIQRKSSERHYSNKRKSKRKLDRYVIPKRTRDRSYSFTDDSYRSEKYTSQDSRAWRDQSCSSNQDDATSVSSESSCQSDSKYRKRPREMDRFSGNCRRRTSEHSPQKRLRVSRKSGDIPRWTRHTDSSHLSTYTSSDYDSGSCIKNVDGSMYIGKRYSRVSHEQIMRGCIGLADSVGRRILCRVGGHLPIVRGILIDLEEMWFAVGEFVKGKLVNANDVYALRSRAFYAQKSLPRVIVDDSFNCAGKFTRTMKCRLSIEVEIVLSLLMYMFVVLHWKKMLLSDKRTSRKVDLTFLSQRVCSALYHLVEGSKKVKDDSYSKDQQEAVREILLQAHTTKKQLEREIKGRVTHSKKVVKKKSNLNDQPSKLAPFSKVTDISVTVISSEEMSVDEVEEPRGITFDETSQEAINVFDSSDMGAAAEGTVQILQKTKDEDVVQVCSSEEINSLNLNRNLSSENKEEKTESENVEGHNEEAHKDNTSTKEMFPLKQVKSDEIFLNVADQKNKRHLKGNDDTEMVGNETSKVKFDWKQSKESERKEIMTNKAIVQLLGSNESHEDFKKSKDQQCLGKQVHTYRRIQQITYEKIEPRNTGSIDESVTPDFKAIPLNVKDGKTLPQQDDAMDIYTKPEPLTKVKSSSSQQPLGKPVQTRTNLPPRSEETIELRNTGSVDESSEDIKEFKDQQHLGKHVHTYRRIQAIPYEKIEQRNTGSTDESVTPDLKAIPLNIKDEKTLPQQEDALDEFVKPEPLPKVKSSSSLAVARVAPIPSNGSNSPATCPGKADPNSQETSAKAQNSDLAASAVGETGRMTPSNLSNFQTAGIPQYQWQNNPNVAYWNQQQMGHYNHQYRYPGSWGFQNSWMQTQPQQMWNPWWYMQQPNTSMPSAAAETTDEVVLRNPLYKTRMCWNGNDCTRLQCDFAHNAGELRTVPHTVVAHYPGAPSNMPAQATSNSTASSKASDV